MFNQINARKIGDEYNVFEGILQSHIFLVIWFLVVGIQVAFMQGVPGVFKVRPQNWAEWLAAIGIGAGSLLVALATKFLSRRCVPNKPSRRSRNSVEAV